MSAFKLTVSTPDEIFYTGDVEYLSVDTPSGRAGFMRGALARICAVKAGRIDVKSAAVAESYYCGDGIMRVGADGVEIILSACARQPLSAAKGEAGGVTDKARKADDGREFKYAKAKIASSILKMKDKAQSDE